MWRLIKNVRLARWWVSALSATSKSEYENALHYLNLMEGVGVDADGGTISRYGIFYRVLKGFVLISVNRRKEAGGVLIEAARQLNSIRNPSDEIKYLKCYVNVLTQSVDVRFSGPPVRAGRPLRGGARIAKWITRTVSRPHGPAKLTPRSHQARTLDCFPIFQRSRQTKRSCTPLPSRRARSVFA